MKYYGQVSLDRNEKKWVLENLAPHVCIKLKACFPKVPRYDVNPFKITATDEFADDLQWFMNRYPLEFKNPNDKIFLERTLKRNRRRTEQLEAILNSPIKGSKSIFLKGNAEARNYQLVVKEFQSKSKRFLLGDDIGLGKTLSSLLTLYNEKTIPALVVVQTHLCMQWADEIKKFTDFKVHVIDGTKPYKLPEADVFIIKYSCLAGWVNVFSHGKIASILFDEVQELRRSESIKYQAAKRIAADTESCIGISGTPIYNYVIEIYNILEIVKPGCLGTRDEFIREWTSSAYSKNPIVKDPSALGTYLRDQYILLRRTRGEVGKELPAVNKIVHTVDYSKDDVLASEELAKQLSLKVLSGNFMERGQAAREFDLLMRQTTGVSKAREVAQYVRMLLEHGEPVVLAGWHREVYEIWLDELKDFNPVMYTGSESEKQKNNAKEDFVSGKTNLFIISLRSGIGLDGLQKRCSLVVIGELDWSPQVHQQLIGRVDRPGQEQQVTAIYLVSEYGSDPVIIDLLGLKSSQSHGVMDPLFKTASVHSDDSRIKLMAKSFLERNYPKEVEVILMEL